MRLHQILSYFLGVAGYTFPFVAASMKEFEPGRNDSCHDDKETLPDIGSDSNILSQTNPPPTGPICQLYLAPSSVPNAGLGVYTTRTILESNYVTERPDAPSILIVDPSIQMAYASNYGDYTWSPIGPGKFEANKSSQLAMTLGAMTNFHPYLYNVRPHNSGYDDTLTSRNSGSPGVGAYSYYGGYHFEATRQIDAGEEIFSDYGENWLNSRSSYDNVPRYDDYETSGRIISTVMHSLNESSYINGTFNNHTYHRMNPVLATIKGVAKILDKRVSSLLPGTSEYLKLVTEGDTLTDIPRKIAEGTISKRTINWIQEEGICLDNLVLQVSTLPHAGNGAFAQRLIKKGDIIVPVPLVQIINSTSLFMNSSNHNSDNDDDADSVATNNVQLLYNYCFSHEKTSMAFCPLSNSILINHCSTRESYAGDCEKYNHNKNPDRRGPNAEVKWASGRWDTMTEHWLQLSLEEIDLEVQNGKRGPSLEIVATRDIQPGDEVFIDYGRAWEKDWERHVSSFVPYSTENYVPVKEMNGLEKLRTLEELEKKPYPQNVRLVCLYSTSDTETTSNASSDEGATSVVHDGSIYVANSYACSDCKFWDCQVLEREEVNDQNTYFVEILSKSRYLTKYPRGSIFFVPEFYQSDQHLLGAFRAPIGLPDEIFPERWKDVSRPLQV